VCVSVAMGTCLSGCFLVSEDFSAIMSQCVYCMAYN
jgi:hypothetical protein